ncbi:MAG: universal stress protein [Euryarchaeota archaeon]|nr:universal stress protein [Euryarchaeota archaeon]
MFTRILYPTDFSDCSKKALGYVKKLKGCGTEEIIVLHVIDERELKTASTTTAWLGETVEEYEEQLLNEITRSAEEQLSAIKDELEDAGMKTSVKLIRGIPFNEIIRIAETENASLIVIGSHGKSNIKEMLLGSVSEKVIRKSGKPVLVVTR